MSHVIPDVAVQAHVDGADFEPRHERTRRFRRVTAIVSALRNVLAFDRYPPENGYGALLSTDQTDIGQIAHPPRKPTGTALSPVRLMPSYSDRPVNVMPAHGLAAGGRPLIMKIPGK